MPWPEDWAEKAYPIVYGRVYHRLRRRGVSQAEAAELAEDAAQHAFLKAAEGAGPPAGFSSFAHFVNWLVLVAYRHALDELRRPGHRARRLPDVLVAPPGGEGEYSPQVWECLKHLQLQERRILLLYYYHDLTDVDIGLLEFDPDDGTPEALGQRAHKLRHKALDHLRQLLMDEGLDFNL